LLKGAELLDHILKLNSSSGKGNLTELSWVGTGFHGFGEVSQNIADRDEVDFGGAGLWNQVEFSWLAVAVSVVISPERRVLFYRLRGSRTGEWGVETKSQELKSRMNRLCIQGPLRKGFWKRVVVSHRIPYVLATLAHYERCSISILLWSWFKASSLLGMSL
jgi:hypothetical protein